jgi:Uma2 family endonuclease
MTTETMREPRVISLTFDEFATWEQRQQDRHELHEGFVFDFAGGTVRHSRICGNVLAWLHSRVSPPCFVFTSDLLIRVGDQDAFYADAGVACSGGQGDTYTEQPTLIVEVMSASSHRTDLVHKRATYRRIPTLRAYLIVDSNRRHVELDKRGADGSWDTTACEAVALVPYGALDVDVIYDGIVFEDEAKA